MKIILGWALASLAAAGCGANVVVDGPSGTGGTTTTTVTTCTTTMDQGISCVSSCAPSLQCGLQPCPSDVPALTLFEALAGCACYMTNPCASVCGDNFCIHHALPPSPCATCIQSNCAAQLMSCQAN
jgi:hypothetical protein